ncbi:hypothetical protein TURU_130904 [Turdus rufiventris]|nr:hypothetical protein TURU_130904 [Turdus rufiventris]
MGTPASVVSDSPGRAAPAARARKRASANIFQGVGLRELRSLFRSGGAERPEERARLVWRYAGQRRMARALRRLRRPARAGGGMAALRRFEHLRWFLNISYEGDPTASLGNLFQCTVKQYCPGTVTGATEEQATCCPSRGEEITHILQGKISLLEDQLAKLEEYGTQENREVMGDILNLKELKQEVSSLAAKRAKLQALFLWLKKEKQLQKAALHSKRGHFEKWLLGSLISSLQRSLSKSHWAQKRLKQDLQTENAKGQPGQLVALNAQHEQTGKGLCPAAAPAVAGGQCIPVQVLRDTSHRLRSTNLL